MPARRRDDRGAAVVDFVLVSLVLVPLFLGIMQVALVMFVRTTLTSAASEGARYAATIDRGPGDGAARARAQMSQAVSGRFARDVDAGDETVDGVAGVVVRVHAVVPALGLWGPGVSRRERPRGQGASPVKRDEAGTAIVEFVWLAVLLLVPLVYVVLAVLDAQRTSFAATTAARSATRAFVTSPDEASAPARARAAARLAFADQGIADAPMGLTLRCSPRPTNCLSPGSVVSAQVRSSVRLPLFPAVLGHQAPAIAVDALHQSPYGTFREDRP